MKAPCIPACARVGGTDRKHIINARLKRGPDSLMKYNHLSILDNIIKLMLFALIYSKIKKGKRLCGVSPPLWMFGVRVTGSIRASARGVDQRTKSRMGKAQ